MSIPLSLLFIPYGLFLVFFVIMSLVYLYHLLRYGAGHMGTYIFIILYVVATVAVISIAAGYLTTIDWSSAIQLIPRIGV